MARRAEVTGNRSRRRLHPDARQRELLDAGMTVLKARGVNARVEDVTSAAGASKGTFYVYFATWADFLGEVRNEVDAIVGKRFVELSRSYKDWRALIAAMPFLHVELVRGLDGLDVIYQPLLAAQIGSQLDGNLEQLIFFLKEARRAKAITMRDPQRSGRLVYGMILQTTQAVLAGDEESAACRLCGKFIVAALDAQPVRRTAGYWPPL